MTRHNVHHLSVETGGGGAGGPPCDPRRRYRWPSDAPPPKRLEHEHEF
jgi:hypothetical protein